MEFGGRVTSTTHMGEVELGHKYEDYGHRQMLRHEIDAIVLARNLREGHDIFRALLLEPKADHVDVTYLRYPLAIDDALGSCSVKLDIIPFSEPISA